jgi:outer membrane protein assembly factor BamB
VTQLAIVRPFLASAGLASALALSALVPVGCAGRAFDNSAVVTPQVESAGLASFVRQGSVSLTPETPLVSIHHAGDQLLAYTDSNKVYFLSRGLEVKTIRQVLREDLTLRPPVVVGDQIIFPGQNTIDLYDKQGQFISRRALEHPLTSNATLDPRGYLVAGTASLSGGRVAIIDPERAQLTIKEDVLLGSVVSAPVAYQAVVYAATSQGVVAAIAEGNRAVWPFEDGRFRTDRGVTADLAVDDYALYVASTDTKLYALDRVTGKIRWRYMAEAPLTEKPYLTRDHVFQVVADRGLVAVPKLDGPDYRQPLWKVPGITKVLGATSKYVFAVAADKSVVAIDRSKGVVRFSIPGQYSLFAVNPADDDMIYLATPAGQIDAYQPSKYGNVAMK